MFLFSFSKKITFFHVKRMVLHYMFLEFLNALPHSMHVTAMMFCKFPSQEITVHGNVKITFHYDSAHTASWSLVR